MLVPATSRQTRTFEDRADALAHFFLRAGEAPRLLAYDDAVGCPLDQALAAIEWTGAVGILAQDDLIHAARLGADAAAAVVERKDADQRVFIYFGPRMDAPPPIRTRARSCTMSPACAPTSSPSGYTRLRISCARRTDWGP